MRYEFIRKTQRREQFVEILNRNQILMIRINASKYFVFML